MAIHFHARDVFRQTVQTLWAHKLRSFLTMFGITWGVMSLLLLGSVGEGFRIGQRRRLAQLGTDLIFVLGGHISSASGSGQTGRFVQLSEQDCRLIARECPLVRACTPVLNRGNIRAESDTNNVAFEVLGIWSNYQGMRFTPLDEGRLINPQDLAEARRVVVLGDEVRKQLFPNYRRAIGQRVRLNQVPFEVVGTLARIGREGNSGTNARLFIPLDTMRRNFPHFRADSYPDAVSFLMLQPRIAAQHKEAIAQYHTVLARRHGFARDDPSALDEWDTIENFNRLNAIFDAMDLFLGGVGIVTLTLGAIGVMNIMLVSVSERTREIGVRKALGATHRDILLQFLLEGLVLALLSGGAGMLLGWGISRALQGLPFPEGFAPPTVTWKVGLVACLVLTVVALGATLIPARRAALLPPVEAIRQEA
jgi:putative ABC transport system permease protein